MEDIERLQLACERAGIRWHHTRDLLDVLFIQGADAFATPEDQAEWATIFEDPVRLNALVVAAHAAEATRVERLRHERRDDQARGLLPARWQPPTIPSARAPALTLADIPVVPWLDPETAGAVQALVVQLTALQPDITAIVLFGSVARQMERSLDDPDPSDVDVLVLYNVPAVSSMADTQSDRETDDRAIEAAISKTAWDTLAEHPSPRQCDVHILPNTLDQTSSLFRASVAEDGITLWSSDLAPVSFNESSREP